LFYENFSLSSKVAGVTWISTNERHGALAHPARPGLYFGYACWPQQAATRPSSQITLGRLVFISYNTMKLYR